ncbi:cGMP-dependent protein kinase 1 isoform X1 [Cyprinodon tularosa]|uniref:cGMP-dependent protein kinase 1 isoform X1 n=2 Tax=Cyprinodon tularosa TaxID=77115 RepID=UPI0018E22265|nr:cGMP-dependent protein kinase 1 isoform X1 [Cyprinodon tularosa]
MGTLRDLQFALQLKIEELRQRDTLIDELELELDTKDELIRRLQEELDRYRAALSLPGPSTVVAASAAQIEDNRITKRQTVISEPITPELMTFAVVSHRSCDKSQESQRLIQAAFLKNDLLKNLDEEEIKAVTACMQRTAINQGCFVIQEGSSGDQAFVLEEGRLDMRKDGQQVLTFEPEDMFGEVTLLYSWTHTYSVSAQTDSKLWAIDRRSFQCALTQCGLRRLSHSVELLRSIPFLESLPDNVIRKLSLHVEETSYIDGDYVCCQGAIGDSFYIISKGQVSVMEKKPGRQEQTVLAQLSERQWFGEKALWGETTWSVNVVAVGEVTCLVIDRWTFRDVIEGSGSDSPPKLQQSDESKIESKGDPASLASSTLSDFQIIRTLGVGEFSHVDLVQLRRNIRCVFAMRVLKKKLILNSGQREHILRERSILMEALCPFLVRLYKTFRDAEHLYGLTEACLGGNLSRLLKEKGHLDETSTKFYTACVVEALSFLHSQRIVYRDVKPENVVLDEQGYGKLISSRCLKRVEEGKRTWTFCGTLGYMAPEIILSRGHSTEADLWSLGVFVFELLSGRLPFDGSDPIKILSASVCGIDQSDFPESFCKDACDLIRKLCRGKPSERLVSQTNGAKAIQKHKWFNGFNWDGLCKRKLTPPLIPKVSLSLQSATCALYSSEAEELCTNWEDF